MLRVVPQVLRVVMMSDVAQRTGRMGALQGASAAAMGLGVMVSQVQLFWLRPWAV